MITYKVTYENDKTNYRQLTAYPTDEEPEFIVTTDFSQIGIISYMVGNAGMKEAIDAVSIITNCEVLSIKRR